MVSRQAASARISRAATLVAISALALIAGAASVEAQGWNPNLGDGRYQNPVLFADFSDPDVIRVGEVFYMTASSFNMVPGLPILESRDLVNWRILSYAIHRLPAAFDSVQHGNGVWAPSLRYHDGWYYIYYGDPDRGIYMLKTRDPRGRWSEPLLVRTAKGWIDPTPLWDDDGTAYLVHAFANSRAGVKSILHVNRMSADGTKLLDDGTLVFDGHAHHPTVEGPKFYKRNGWYYIFAPAGGVATGWQTVLRSRHVMGPYEDRIVLAQGSTPINGPHQGAWVQLANGDDWFVHFQDRGAYGRITHLEPMVWKNDWPVIGVDPDSDGTGEPVLVARKPNVRAAKGPALALQTSDEFDASRLGLAWQWQGNPRPLWFSLRARPGALRLEAQARGSSPNLWPVPSLLLQKLSAPELTATTKLTLAATDTGDLAGLIVFGMDYAYVAVRRGPHGLDVVQRRAIDAPKGTPEETVAAAHVPGASIHLRVSITDGASCQFSYSQDGTHFVDIGTPFIAREGRWVGAKMGLFATKGADSDPLRGHADFDFFRVLSRGQSQ